MHSKLSKRSIFVQRSMKKKKKIVQRKLTAKQKKFCEQYVIDCNGTQGAIRAGYSKNTAYSIAEQLLRKLEVKEYIQKLQAEIEERSRVKADDVINELAKIAFSDVGKIFTTDNRILDVTQMEENQTRAIQSVEVDELREGDMTIGTTKKVKLYDKIRALEALGKHFGIFERDNKQKATGVVTVFKLPENGR